LHNAQDSINASKLCTAAEVRAHQQTCDNLEDLQITLESTKLQSSRYYQLLRTERRKNQRLRATKQSLSIVLTELRTVELPAAIREARRAERELVEATLDHENFIMDTQLRFASSRAATVELKAAVVVSRKKIQALQMQCARAKHSQAQAIAKAQQKQRRQSHTYKMMNRGEYSAGVRKLARAFAKGGCSQEQIGPLIRMTGQTIGVKVKGKLSRRTISRCIREGGVAARIQLGYELAHTKSPSVRKHLQQWMI
jgi:anthranilate/para-aminobenzoate synthase component I